ncbi:hypothetical protein ALQ29_04498 [Pseudomonas marginalis pv. marginalis]|uniref:Bacterial surface antigen (D15) domain-containing protein n=1 Tax=Pseudomonas marginalis pv. marginalis TaxID=97473 RepID=A0A3M4A658_PSEMA|nr:hypothetical protein ALQ38_02815 [Pseudomonas marginalis pv. marginalis]RMP02411.1 hypothetical protein ALQ29_04498 [Pseudomonas marginalis pv. marginalis]
MRTSLFWDVGSVYSDKCYLSTTQGCGGVDLSQMASSVGVGVTWYSPRGPLSVNLAYPIRTPENADKQAAALIQGPQILRSSATGKRWVVFISRSDRFERILNTPGSFLSTFSTNLL